MVPTTTFLIPPSHPTWLVLVWFIACPLPHRLFTFTTTLRISRSSTFTFYPVVRLVLYRFLLPTFYLTLLIPHHHHTIPLLFAIAVDSPQFPTFTFTLITLLQHLRSWLAWFGCSPTLPPGSCWFPIVYFYRLFVTDLVLPPTHPLPYYPHLCWLVPIGSICWFLFGFYPSSLGIPRCYLDLVYSTLRPLVVPLSHLVWTGSLPGPYITLSIYRSPTPTTPPPFPFTVGLTFSCYILFICYWCVPSLRTV